MRAQVSRPKRRGGGTQDACSPRSLGAQRVICSQEDMKTERRRLQICSMLAKRKKPASKERKCPDGGTPSVPASTIGSAQPQPDAGARKASDRCVIFGGRDINASQMVEKHSHQKCQRVSASPDVFYTSRRRERRVRAVCNTVRD